MSKPKIIVIDLSDVAEDVLTQLAKASIIVRISNADGTRSYVGGRGVNKMSLKKAMKAGEVKDEDKQGG